MVGHMQELRYGGSTPLYAASGLLSYNDTGSKHILVAAPPSGNGVTRLCGTQAPPRAAFWVCMPALQFAARRPTCRCAASLASRGPTAATQLICKGTHNGVTNPLSHHARLPAGMQRYTESLRKDGVCSKVVVKEDYLSAKEMAGACGVAVVLQAMWAPACLLCTLSVPVRNRLQSRDGWLRVVFRCSGDPHHSLRPCTAHLSQACTRSRRRCWTCWCYRGQTSLWAPSAGQGLHVGQRSHTCAQCTLPPLRPHCCFPPRASSALVCCGMLPTPPELLPALCSAFSYMARELRHLGGKNASSTRLHPMHALAYDVVLDISKES